MQTVANTKPKLVNPHAFSHGDYRREHIVDLTGELGEGRQRIHKVLRNRGGSTIERWLANGSLSRGQVEAIALYARTWQLAIGEQRVTTNWSLVSTVRGLSIEEWLKSKAEAMELLKSFDELVFNAMPPKYVDCWKNVVIFDEAAGVAGSRLGYSNRNAEASAKTICLFIADIIATVMRLGTP